MTTGFFIQSQCRFEPKLPPSIARALIFRTKGTQAFLIQPRNLGSLLSLDRGSRYELRLIITYMAHIRL